MAESFDPRAYARQMAGQYGLDPEIFVKMLFAESRFNPNVKPSVVRGRDYVGYGQLGAAAAQDVGITDRFDPRQNIEGSARYLKMQLDEFGSYPLALAAYNAGPQTVRDKGGIPNYPETQAYIEKIMGNNTMDPDDQIITRGQGSPLLDETGQVISDEEGLMIPATVATQNQTQAPQGMQNLLQQLIGQRPQMQAAAQEPTDPYENLSKTQRRMLAFAAIKDAGMALQGVEGRSVERLMGDFTERADQARKAKAAQAQQQMMQQMFGGGGTMGGGMTGGMDISQMSPEQMRTRAQQLAQTQAMYPSLTLTPMIDMLVKEADRIETAQKAEIAAASSASDTLQTVDDLLRTVKEKEGTTGMWGWMFGKIPWTEAGQVRIDAQTLRSNMALDALMNLKASGATLGSVSEKELDLLESDIKNLNLNQSKEKVLADLNKIKRSYEKIIKKAYLTTNDKAKLDQALGGEPPWLAGGPEPSDENPLGL